MSTVSEPSARILIVDDTDANRYALRRFVEGAGHTVLEANTGESGFAIADREHPDLVILDVNLPDIDGFATCRRIKTNPHTADIPVIQVSASFVRAPEQVKGLEGGADAYLTQPVEPMVLLATVKAVLRAHRTERELRQVQMQLRAALEAAGMETFSIDWPTRQIWRYTEPALHNQKMQSYARPLDDFIASAHVDDRQVLRQRIEASIASQQRYEVEYRVDVQGETRCRLERGHVATDASGAAQLIGVSMDITERKAMVEALVQADQRKDEFLAMLAHELRNPLAPIRNAARVLDQLTTMQQENVKAMLAVIHRQVNQMTRLVDDLLDVSRITRGKVELKLEPMLLSNVVDYAVETTRPLIDSRRHELILDITPEPLWVTGDFARLGQALSNILSNAAKYTEPGGHIEVRMKVEGSEAVISVKDDGIGIPPALLPEVFDLFMQGDRTLDRAQGGLGIGLALVKSMIDFHHGSVRAYSEGAGRGSEFIIRLPLSQPTSTPRATDPVSTPIARQRRILIVDDNRDSAESMAALLRMDQHEVHIAHTGPAAVQLAATLKPEVIFLDIGLPGMSGLEVVRRLRNIPETARSKIIALTGYGQPEDYRRSLAAGFDQHLVKPLDPAAVASILRE